MYVRAAKPDNTWISFGSCHTGPVDAKDAEQEVTAALHDLDAATFTDLHILDRVPAIFASREQYAKWRGTLASDLGVDPLCLVVVGSTAVGVSLSPKTEKHLKAYHDESDIDLAIVSPLHFEEAWQFLRGLGPAANLQGRPDIADLLRWHRRSLVFDGTIATDQLLPHLPFAARWQGALGRAGNAEPTQDRDVKARIYRDFESLRVYHRRNVESIKAGLTVKEEGLKLGPSEGPQLVNSEASAGWADGSSLTAHGLEPSLEAVSAPTPRASPRPKPSPKPMPPTSIGTRTQRSNREH